MSGIKLTVDENVPSTPIGQSSRASIQISNPVPMEQNSEFTPVMQQCKTTLGHQNQAAPAVQRVMKRSLAVSELFFSGSSIGCCDITCVNIVYKAILYQIISLNLFCQSSNLIF